MKKTIIAAAIMLATSAAAHAQQYYDPAAAYMAGPPLQLDPVVTPTWSGMTQWGWTIYYDVSDGTHGVAWQPNPNAPMFVKTSDGQVASFSAAEVRQALGVQPAYPSVRVAPQGTLRATCVTGYFC